MKYEFSDTYSGMGFAGYVLVITNKKWLGKTPKYGVYNELTPLFITNSKHELKIWLELRGLKPTNAMIVVSHHMNTSIFKGLVFLTSLENSIDTTN